MTILRTIAREAAGLIGDTAQWLMVFSVLALIAICFWLWFIL